MADEIKSGSQPACLKYFNLWQGMENWIVEE